MQVSAIKILNPKSLFQVDNSRRKTDTVFREALEQDTLIASIELNRKIARIHTITPLGIPLIKEYELPQFRQIRIDHEGNLAVTPKKQRRNKFWRNLERIGVFVGGIYLGSQFIK